ncbi:TIGR02217 family protein [Oricola sp.]|uniref:phage distal tail protein, Rcc01695 family n=1 Tax=Oricola sp. TaxID=1979950 RepID=UPI0035191919
MSFHDVIFPSRLAFGARGGPERQVEIVRLASGLEQRNVRWSRARRTYAISTGIKSFTDLHKLLEFFEDRGGPLHGFRFLDPVDHASASPGEAVTPTDRQIGTGDGAATEFQLKLGNDRPVTKPVDGTVRIAVDGAELFEPAFSVDLLTGIVTLAEAPDEGVPVTAGFEFHVPVRFDTALLSMTQTAFEAGEIPDIRLVEVFE